MTKTFPIHGYVCDAGGGTVTVMVDRDTLEYPEVATLVTLSEKRSVHTPIILRVMNLDMTNPATPIIRGETETLVAGAGAPPKEKKPKSRTLDPDKNEAFTIFLCMLGFGTLFGTAVFGAVSLARLF